MRRATMAGGGGLGLSQLTRRYSGAIVGLRGASHERRRRTPVGGCSSGFGFGFGAACVGAAAGFFMAGGGDGGREEASSVVFLAVRRFRWRW
jgi:hypothetical protein